MVSLIDCTPTVMFMSQLSLPLLSISASSTDALGLVADTPLDDEGNKRFKQRWVPNLPFFLSQSNRS